MREIAAGNKWSVGRKLSPESRERMRQAMLNSEWHKNHKLPEDERIARDRVRRTAKRFVYRILKMPRKRKDKRSEVILGYSKSQLREHLEKQFRDGMSWSNIGSFHVDHIIPVAHFLSRGITDIAVINALSNLQVLTPHENRKKSASMGATLRGSHE
jgi:hypothetical protein